MGRRGAALGREDRLAGKPFSALICIPRWGCCGFADRLILDLGSLEGGHSYSFERLGAREVVAIEGKTRASLRCLVAKELRFDSFTCAAYRHRYSVTLLAPAFCGGTDRYSHWMTRDDILGCFRHFGFADVRIGFEVTDHPNGPSFNLVAVRPGGRVEWTAGWAC